MLDNAKLEYPSGLDESKILDSGNGCKLVETTLSDGSKGYEVQCPEYFTCADKKAAYELFTFLTKNKNKWY